MPASTRLSPARPAMFGVAGRSARGVLVLGAEGFVGARIVAALAEAGIRPVAGLRSRSAVPAVPDAETYRCNASDPAALETVLEGVDTVVNCADGSPRAMIAATRAICAAARRRPARIVHLSSIAVYGDATGPVSETSPLTAPATRRGAAGRVCERMIGDYVRDGGDAVILRTGLVYGPGSDAWTSRLARLLRAGRIGDLGSAGDGICNLLYIDDLAAAVIAARSCPEVSGKTINLGTPSSTTWNAVLVQFGRLIGATPVKRIAPWRLAAETTLAAPVLGAGRLALRLAGVPARRLPVAVTPSLARVFRQEIWFDTAEASALLPMGHTTLDAGLCASARWFSEPVTRAVQRAGPVEACVR